ncbi:MAG TPA: response regulator [Gryllotalpicola sp.]
MTVRVAVVDDDAGFRRVAVLVLTARGYEVIGEASDAAAGYELIAAARPDAALIDYHLPDESGAELCARVRGLPHPPRVLLTSSDTAAPGPASDIAFVAKERLASVDLHAYL